MLPVACKHSCTKSISRRLDPTSEYLFYPNEGCIYWLGDVSPDGKRVLVFELNHDDRNVRAGV